MLKTQITYIWDREDLREKKCELGFQEYVELSESVEGGRKEEGNNDNSIVV